MSDPGPRRSVAIYCELFHPEQTSTGAVITALATHLREAFDVEVVASQPSYSALGDTAPPMERWKGLTIRRPVRAARDAHRVDGRIVNAAVYGTFCVRHARRSESDVAIYVTNPPILPLLARAVRRFSGARQLLVVHDIAPEVFAAASRGRSIARLTPLFRRMYRIALSSFDLLVAAGPDQKEMLVETYGLDPERIHVIPIATDEDLEVTDRTASELWSELSSAFDLTDRTVFQFAGNAGPLQGVDSIVESIDQCRDLAAHFCFVASGRRVDRVRELAERNDHVSLWPPRPRALTGDVHAACDVALVSLSPGMRGVSVPSRIANILASGVPMLCVTDEGSTAHRLVREHAVGWWAPPEDPVAFREAVTSAMDPVERSARARNAADFAARFLRPEVVHERYLDILGVDRS